MKQDEPRKLPIGTMLANKYKVVRYLASGGFGNTYEAIDTAFDERVAIKELFLKGMCDRKEGSNDVSVSVSENKRDFQEHVEKFRKEARRLRKLKNDHIVTVHDLFDENGTAYYVMDFIDGESLSARLKRTGKPLTEDHALRVLDQMLVALSAIHEVGIWHLDIKPANIMEDKDGNIRLIDFGASKQLYNEDGSTKSTSSVLCYTMGYAPPEQTEQNIKKFGAYTDIYALGATLYNLLSNNLPPLSSDINDSGEEIFQFPASVSPKTRQLVIWMMKNRSERPQNVAEIREYLNGGTIVEPEEGDDDTIVRKTDGKEPGGKVQDRHGHPFTEHFRKYGMKYAAFAAIAAIAVILFAVLGGNSEKNKGGLAVVDSDTTVPQPQSFVSKTFTVKGVSFTMIPVKAGTFTMGATSEQQEPYDDEKPAHRITLTNDYYIGQTEVTQELWQAVMGSNPSYFKGSKRPVENISWNDCQKFIKKLNSLTGKSFRLPTEAELEFAARGGNKSKGYQYSGSNNIGEVAWYNGNSNSATHDVATKQPNELGIYDMSGNVLEWCQDWYGSYSSSAQTNPTGANSGSIRVYRGGSWSLDAGRCRSADRFSIAPGGTYYDLGLRLALSEL